MAGARLKRGALRPSSLRVPHCVCTHWHSELPSKALFVYPVKTGMVLVTTAGHGVLKSSPRLPSHAQVTTLPSCVPQAGDSQQHSAAGAAQLRRRHPGVAASFRQYLEESLGSCATPTLSSSSTAGGASIQAPCGPLPSVGEVVLFASSFFNYDKISIA